MRFEFSIGDVQDLFAIIDYTYSKIPSGAAYKQVKAIMYYRIKIIIRKIMDYGRDVITMQQTNRLLSIWKKITGEDYDC